MVGSELDFIRESVEAMHTGGDGPFSRRCTDLLQAELGCAAVFPTTSCTAALEMCALLLNLAPGDEVIVPAYSFVSTVNAFALRGTTPVFADIREDTLNLDEARLESLISSRTRAVVVVHYAGVGCEMETISEIAVRRGIAVVEDNAHGLFARYRGRYLGTFGCLATLSFHETKNFSCGEGGGLLVNDPAFVRRAEIIRDKGTNRQQLFRGEVDKYTWVDLGSSYVLSDILAAYLCAQLEQRDTIMSRRRALWEFYDSQLRGVVEAHGIRLPTIPDHCEQGYHMYYMILPSLEVRQALIAHLKRHRIASVFHYTPLHLSRMGRSCADRAANCPVTERISERLLRLPFHHELEREDQQRVTEEIHRFLAR
jgi:dTDP-4-amino-4,6-dideoxygalactose transaminase